MPDPKPRKKNTEFAAKVKLAELKQYVEAATQISFPHGTADGEAISANHAIYMQGQYDAFKLILARLTPENGK